MTTGAASTHTDLSRPISLFLAEGQAAISDVLTAYLRSQPGFVVLGEASNVHEALACCQELHPDVLVVDHGMHEIDGARLAETLRQHSPETKIVYFADSLDARNVRTMLAAGADGIVEKTTHVNVLVEAIVAVASGRTYFTPKITSVLREAAVDPAWTSVARGLTAREKEVLRFVAKGHSNKEISTELGVGLRTVENHRWHLMRKLQARNAADLTRAAYDLGLVSRG